MSRLLVRLIALFPLVFQRQFGPDMAEQILVDHERARARGRLQAFAHFLAQAFDLLRSAAGEHCRPTWAVAPRRTEGTRSMSSTTPTWTRLLRDELRQDLRQAVRALRRTPGFVAVTVLTLGLAIGVNAGLFSVVDTVLLEPLPYRDADRLVTIAGTAPGTDLPPEFGVSAEFYLQYREHSELLENVAIYNRFTSTLRVGDVTERVSMSFPTTSLFDVLGVTPLLGRLPTEEDESRVAVISHALWTSWFGSDPNVIGRTLNARGTERTVIAVMGPDFWFPDDRVLLWVPNVLRNEEVVPGRLGIGLVARLAPGASPAELTPELQRLALGLPERFGGSPAYQRIIAAHRPLVRALEDDLFGVVERPLWVLLGSVAIVLMIACANVANLLLVRAERRQRDLAVQRAIGAGRGRLIRSQLAEAFVLASLAGALAVVLAWAVVPLFVRAAPAEIPRLAQVGLSWRTLAFTVFASFSTALLCGVLPAIRASAPVLSPLRDGGRGTTRRRHWGRSALVVAQTALALVLLIGSGLLVRSFWQLRSVDPGYDTADLFSFQVAPEGAHLTDAASYARFHFELMERLRALPGVGKVGLVENLPLDERLSLAPFRTDAAGRDTDAASRASVTWAAGDYFEAMGIALLQGRAFDASDHTTNLGNVIVSESAARLFWPGEDPIGRKLQRTDLETWDTVVGVVADVKQYSFRDAPEPLLYFPIVGASLGDDAITSPAFVLDTARAETIAPEVRALIREVAPGAPMYRVYTLEGLAADSMVQLSFTMLTLGFASALALVLGAIGLYGVLSYVVAERTQEIGVRMALGAAPGSVQRMVVVQGSRVLFLGIALGILAALALTGVLDSLLYEVAAVDVATFVWMSIGMAMLGLLSTYLPARRASTVDPIRSLRDV